MHVRYKIVMISAGKLEVYCVLPLFSEDCKAAYSLSLQPCNVIPIFNVFVERNYPGVSKRLVTDGLLLCMPCFRTLKGVRLYLQVYKALARLSIFRIINRAIFFNATRAIIIYC